MTRPLSTPRTPSDVDGVRGGAPSREVCWSAAFEVLHPVMERAQRHGDIPTVGTHEWIGLPDGDPRKIGSVYAAALLWALYLENEQTAAIEAAQDISPSHDWAQLARRQRNRNEFANENPWARRIPA